MTNDAPKPNVELLDRTLAEVRRAARRTRLGWNQSAWRQHTECGTAMCFAGWAAHLSGVAWADATSPELPCDVRLPDGKIRCVSGVARDLLGLTLEDASHLFRHTNTLRDLSRIVREIKQRA